MSSTREQAQVSSGTRNPVPATDVRFAETRISKALQRSALDLAAAALCGIALWRMVRHASAGDPAPGHFNVFSVLFARFELAPLTLLLLFVPFAIFAVRHAGRSRADELAPPSKLVFWLAAAVVPIGVLGWYGVFHAYPLSMDEYAAVFQASVFARGRLDAPIPAAWIPYAPAAVPVFIVGGFHPWSWVAAYLPVYPAIRAPLEALGAGALANPLLAAASLLLVAAVAGRAWPEARERGTLAALLLAASSQFLVMSMTAYAMPAMLAVNLLWLWLYQRDDRWSRVGLHATSAVAVGLNNPFPHILFAAPFLLRLLRERRFARLIGLAAVYAMAAAGWYYYMARTNPLAQQGRLHSLFVIPDVARLFVQALSFELVLTWQTPVVALLILFGVRNLKSLSAFEKDLALGVAASLAFYAFFFSDQGHGWGYRYVYPAMGNIALLSAAALSRLSEAAPAAARRLLLGSLALTLIQLPIRLWEAESVTRPFAHAYARIAASDRPIVLVPTDSAWYGQDLVRNEPWRRDRPLLLRQDSLTRDRREALRRRPDAVLVVSVDSLRAWGIPVEDQ